MHIVTFAKGNVDYTSGPYSVKFTAGVTIASFDVLITNDNTSEGNETFNLAINGSLLPEGISVGNPDQVTVTIVDDDG